jgi:AraC family transcriptional regulator
MIRAAATALYTRQPSNDLQVSPSNAISGMFAHDHTNNAAGPNAIAGEVLQTRRVSGFTFLDSQYPRGLALARHFHRNAYLSFVLEGSYSELYASGSSHCGLRSLRFLPAGEIHSNVYEAGARCLLVEIDPQVIVRLTEHSHTLAKPGEIPGVSATWLANKLYREFRQGDDVSLVSLEGLVLEILADAARAEEGKPSAELPRWLRRAREVLDAQFLQGVSLTDLAAEAGVHAVHLSREFRKRFHCSVGEYLRKRRVEHACHLIANSELTLCEIALTCGFADQSHFSKTFKRQIGLTPAHFRTLSATS